MSDENTETNREKDSEEDGDAEDSGDTGEKFDEVMNRLRNDDEIAAYLEAQNVTAVNRLKYNDHGPKHIGIVRKRALELTELLKNDVSFGVEDHDLGFWYEDARIVVALAATLHDIGHIVHRDSHVYYSIELAHPILDRILDDLYDTDERIAIKGDALHAMLCHHVEEDPLTPEAGIVRVADALDMEEGRSRLPYRKGERSIDTVSSQAIKSVAVKDGEEEYGVPVLVEIHLTNSAGVYQIDNLLKSKLRGSGLEGYTKIIAINDGDDEIVGRLEL